MTPIEKLIIERTCDDFITDNVYQIKVFGLVVYQRVYHNNVVAQRRKTSGFDVLPDERQEIEDIEE